METNTIELVLAEIIKINNKIDPLVNEVKELKLGQEEIIKTINYIGNKVFDNHEVRIARLESAS